MLIFYDWLYRAAPLFCAGITAYSALVKSQVRAGQLINIVGCGGVGSCPPPLLLDHLLIHFSPPGHIAVLFAKAMGYRVNACKKLRIHLTSPSISTRRSV